MSSLPATPGISDLSTVNSLSNTASAAAAVTLDTFGSVDAAVVDDEDIFLLRKPSPIIFE